MTTFIDIPFKQQFDYAARLNESRRITIKYPDRVPVIVERAANSPVNLLEKKKYLLKRDMTAAEFIYFLRQKINIEADQALFLFYNNTLAPSSSIMSSIYNEHKDKDGFLYIVYSGESTFGTRSVAAAR